MKTRFIKINDISNINTSKISVHDLNNRYLDSTGNMYGLKYNRKTRKIDIIKIIRTPVNSAEYYRQQLRNGKRNKKISREAPAVIENSDLDIVTESDDSDDMEAEKSITPDFDPNVFIEKTSGLMQTHKDRLLGIMMNIKNSRVISEDNRMNANEMTDLFRNIDIDGVQRIDKILTAYKELKNYPRSISYYLSKLDNDSREIIENIDSDTKKLNYISLVEMRNAIRNLYTPLHKTLKDLIFYLESQNPDEMKDLTFSEKQSFHDAQTSAENTIDGIVDILTEVKTLGTYLHDPKNF